MSEPVILLGEYGSVAQGTAGPDSDHDYMGVYMDEPAALIGLSKESSKRVSDSAEGQKSLPASTDTTYHGLRKFCQLAAGGNPTVGSILWLPKYEKLTTTGEILLNIRGAFSSKKAGYAYLGYMDAQIKAFDETGRKNRVELVQKYGYDIKFGYHAFRLGVQGLSLMKVGHPMIPLVDEWLQYATEIRQGIIEKPDLVYHLEVIRKALAEAIDNSELPDYPDTQAINQFLEESYIDYWDRGII